MTRHPTHARRTAPAGVVALLLASTLLTGCGDAGEPVPTLTLPPSTSATASTTPSAAPPSSPGTPGVGEGSADAADPERTEAIRTSMLASLDGFVDRGRTPDDRAGDVVGGRDLAPVLQQLDARLGDSLVTFRVDEPEAVGLEASARITVLTDGTVVAGPSTLDFAPRTGQWRLDRVSACLLLSVAGIECPSS